MSTAIADARLREHAECRYVLFFDGLPYAFTDDTGAEITGGASGSWIGLSQTELGGTETVSGLERTVLPGLKVPSSLVSGGNPKGTGLERNTATFEILDTDNVLGSMFAVESEEYDILNERIASGVSNIADSHPGEGPGGVAGSIQVRGRHVGLERIGPTGERRCFPALPDTLVGFDHVGDVEGRVPYTIVSDDPLVHDGRLVTLWRIYKNPTSSTGTVNDWYLWDEHFPADLVWWGTMRDTFETDGDHTWKIKCLGQESLLEKGMGRITTSEWYPITTDLTAETNDQIAIHFESSGSATDDPAQLFEGRAFTTISGTNRGDLLTEINGLLTDTAAGTNTDIYTANTNYDAWTEADGSSLNVGIDDTGLFLRKDKPDPASYFGICKIAMHRSRWLILGFDPELQGVSSTYEIEDGSHIIFRRVSVEGYSPGFDDSVTMVVPGSSYYEATLTTISLGGSSDKEVAGSWDNGGTRRYYVPLFSALTAPVILDRDAKQVIQIATHQSPFFEPQPTAPWSSDAAINGTPCDAARYFVLRGKIRTAEYDTSGTLLIDEADDQIAVCRASWVQGSTHGSVATDGVFPALYVERFYDPRLFGYPHRPLKGDWAGTATGDFQIQISPLFAYAYGQGGTPELASDLWGQVTSSSGSSSGFSGPVDTGGTIDQGDNNVPGLVWSGDLEGADMALGIPNQFLTADQVLPFHEVQGGRTSPLNRMRLCFHGPYKSRDVIESILRPRRLLIGLHGNKYTPYRLGRFSPADADVTITESDVHGSLRNLFTARPKQRMRAFGALDEVHFSYAYEPGGSAKLEWTQGALDPGATRRRGDLIERIPGRGLVPSEWLPGKNVEGKDWKLIAREEWGKQAAELFAARHDLITLTISRPKGQDLRPGTKVLLSNPWPLAPDGTQGITNLIGIVTSTDHQPRKHACKAKILVFADQANTVAHFAPIVYPSSVSGTTIVYHDTVAGFGRGELWSDSGFVRPEWAGGSGNAVGQLWYMGPGGTWSTAGTAEISSIDTTTRTITLAGALSGSPPPHTSTMIFCLAPYSQQPSWVQEVYAPIVSPGGFTGATHGRRWPSG